MNSIKIVLSLLFTILFTILFKGIGFVIGLLLLIVVLVNSILKVSKEDLKKLKAKVTKDKLNNKGTKV